MAATRTTVAKWKFALIETDSGLVLRERYIALVMAVHMDKSGETWASLDKLAAESRQGKHTVKKYVDSLEAKGWCIRVKGRSGQSAHTFASTPESGAAQGDTALPNRSGAVSDESGAAQGDTRTPELHRTPRGKFKKEIPDQKFFDDLNEKWSMR